MVTRIINSILLAIVITANAAEKVFDFSELSAGDKPAGFKSLLAGSGEPGKWEIVYDEAPQTMKTFSTRAATSSSVRPVLAQLSKDPTDERFPIFVYDEEIFDDFTFTTRFKIVDGVQEQMAGVVFRLTDQNNFYVARANAKDGNFRFYKVLNGMRGTLIGPSMEIKKGVWYELSIECKGNEITILLDGKEVMPKLKDNSFSKGKIGFWTKSDSVAYFSGAKITYKPREPYAQDVVRETLSKYSRLLGLKIYAKKNSDEPVKLIASDKPEERGALADKAEIDVINRGVIYTAKGKTTYEVYMPMRDRNGDVIACARFIIRTFPGQTEQNAIARCLPVLKYMEAKVRSLEDLYE